VPIHLRPYQIPIFQDNSTGALQIEDRSEAAKRIREELFGKYTKGQLEAVALANA
jgi:hypothetical protein